jgi:hypothetical protein
MEKGMKKFSYHWGSGYVAEEAQVTGPYHLPTFQLLKYTEGNATGSESIRFSHYSHRGQFQRSPLMMSADEIAMMRDALLTTPELRKLLKQLVED